MKRSSTQDTAILYHNAESTIFLVDIPHSIALAQESGSPIRTQNHPQATTSSSTSPASIIENRRWLLSTPPPKTPFPSTEPKSHAARAKVLERIPASELRFHREFIQPLVESSLEILRTESQLPDGQWCLARRCGDDESERQLEMSTRNAGRKRRNEEIAADEPGFQDITGEETSLKMPPVILSSTAVTSFESFSELTGSIVKNISSKSATLAIRSHSSPRSFLGDDINAYTEYIIPPHANFILCTLPLLNAEPKTNSFPKRISTTLNNPVPSVPSTQKFNLLLFDPPWPNRSVKRSGHYQVHHYSEMDLLTQRLRDILRVHSFHTSLPSPQSENASAASVSGSVSSGTRSKSCASLAAIWITNAEKARRAAYESLSSTGFQIIEEWVWVKTTIDGRPISAADGIWRKPYEVLVIGRADSITTVGSGVVMGSPSTSTLNVIKNENRNDLLGIDPAGIKRRVIAAVPDLHSRKPNLREVFERIFFIEEVGAGLQSYSAMEIFARNLTAGWWACGNEVLKFNARECWVDDDG